MQMTTTTVKVKCDCKIPFQSELEQHLEQLITTETITDIETVADFKTVSAILRSKMIFIKVTSPIKDIRPRLLKSLKLLLNKDLVGFIKGSKNEITLIML